MDTNLYELLEDVREWNREWVRYDKLKSDHKHPKMPRVYDQLMDDLNLKYCVSKL